MSKYWRAFARAGQTFVALYVETYMEAVYFDLSQAERSIIRSVPGDFPSSGNLNQTLAQRACRLYAQKAGWDHAHLDVEEVEAIPRCLLGVGIGGDEETCAVVVYEQHSAKTISGVSLPSVRA